MREMRNLLRCRKRKEWAKLCLKTRLRAPLLAKMMGNSHRVELEAPRRGVAMQNEGQDFHNVMYLESMSVAAYFHGT
jgi:hypothetical protein